MDLARFQELNKIYSKLPLPKEVLGTKEYNDYINAFHDDKDCQEWELKRRIKLAGLDIKKYCCIKMAYYLIEDKKAKTEVNYDAVITQTKSKDFGIPIHDGGSSYIEIHFCPWCGNKLK